MLNDLDFFKKQLGRRIAFLREQNGLTQSQLGALINKDFQSISRIENGRVNVSGYTLKQIADAMNVGIGSLFNFSANQ